MNDDSPPPPRYHALRIAMHYLFVSITSLVLASIVYLVKYRAFLPNMAWWAPVAIAVGILVVCLAFGFLASRMGERRATNWIGLILGLLLCLSMFALTRYLDHR